MFSNNCVSLLTWKNKLWVGEGDRSTAGQAAWWNPDFFLTSKAYSFSHPSLEFLSLEQAVEQLAPGSLRLPVWQSPKWDLFETQFSNLSAILEASLLEKAVPYITLKAEWKMKPKALLYLLKRAFIYKQSHPESIIYGSWTPEGGILGVSPEMLFELEGHTLKTMACAATLLPGVDASDPLLAEEHEWVIKGIEEKISQWGRLESGQRGLRSFGSLSHFVTPLTLELNKEVFFNDILRALHPTPALGAWPQEPGSEWLNRYALDFPRRFYGAPFGFSLDKAAGFAAVAIRGVEWDKNSISITAGGGVVRGFSYSLLKEEVEAKLRFIQSTFFDS